MSSSTFTVVNPATATPVTDVPLADLADTDAAIERAHAAFPAWRDLAARRAGHAPAPVRGRGRRAHRRAGRARGPQRRPHLGQRPLGGRQRPRLPQLLLRRPGAPVRAADPGGRRRRRHLPRAARRGRHHRPLELPDADRGLGLRAGAGGRQHRRPQARRADPAHRDPARRAGPGGRPARGRPHRDPGQGLGRRRAVRHPPAGPQGLLHRLDRGRQADHARLRRPGEAGDPRARWQERQHRVRRRRPGRGGRQRAVRRLRQRRPGLLRPLADPRRAVGVRRVPGAAGAGGVRDAGAGPLRRVQRDGAADLRAAARHRARLPRRGGGRVRRAARPAATASGCRRAWC